MQLVYRNGKWERYVGKLETNGMLQIKYRGELQSLISSRMSITLGHTSLCN
jgi:hypothetical protein